MTDWDTYFNSIANEVERAGMAELVRVLEAIMLRLSVLERQLDALESDVREKAKLAWLR